MSPNAIFQIQAPTGFTFPNNPCTNQTWNCLNATAYFIRITGVGISNNGSSNLAFSMINPPAAINLTRTTFIVTVLENNTVMAEATVSFGFRLTPGASVLSVSPSSTIVNATNVNYIFNITNVHNLTMQNWICLTIPFDIDVSQARLVSFLIDGQIINSAIMTLNGNQLFINNALQSLNGTHSFSISISGLRNPPMRSSYPFSVSFLLNQDPIDVGVANILYGARNSDPVILTTSTSITNGEATDISFIIVRSSGLPPENLTMNQYKLNLIYPQEFVFCNCTSLTADRSYGDVSYSVTDSNSGYGSLECVANLSFTTVETSIGFTISCINPQTTQPTSPFNVSLRDENNTDIVTGTFIYFTQFGVWLSATEISKEPNIPGVLTKACTNILRLSAGSINKIQVYPDPSLLPPLNNVSLYCSAFTTINNNTCYGPNCTQIINNLGVNCNLNPLNIEMTLGGENNDTNISICFTILNPLISNRPLANTRIITLASSNFMVDDNANVTMAPSLCDFPCKTCQLGNPTWCTSCFSAAVTNFNSWDSNNLKCVDSCPIGTYNVPDNPLVCQKCDSNCLTCSLSASNCTDCPAGSVLFFGRCINICPVGFYPSNNNGVRAPICRNCSANCLTCAQGPGFCTSCPNNTMLSDTSCVRACPDSQFIGLDQNNNSRCFACSSNCKNCRGSSTNCIACDVTNPNKKALSNGVCIAACLSGYFPNPSDGNCIKCADPCSQCAGTNSTCTSCSGSTPYLQKDRSTCVANCSAGYILSSGWCIASPIQNITNNTSGGNTVSVTISGISDQLSRSSIVKITASAALIGTDGFSVAGYSVNSFNYTFILTSSRTIDQSAMIISGRTIIIKPFTLDFNVNYTFNVRACLLRNTSLCGYNSFTISVAIRNVIIMIKPNSQLPKSMEQIKQ